MYKIDAIEDGIDEGRKQGSKRSKNQKEIFATNKIPSFQIPPFLRMVQNVKQN